MFTLFVRVRACVCGPPRLLLAPSPSFSPPWLHLDVYARTCMREFRNEHRIYGLARLDSIPFASSPVIPLDFVRLRPASLSDARLPDRVFLNNSSAPLLGARLGTADRPTDDSEIQGLSPDLFPEPRLPPFRARVANKSRRFPNLFVIRPGERAGVRGALSNEPRRNL